MAERKTTGPMPCLRVLETNSKKTILKKKLASPVSVPTWPLTNEMGVVSWLPSWPVIESAMVVFCGVNMPAKEGNGTNNVPMVYMHKNHGTEKDNKGGNPLKIILPVAFGGLLLFSVIVLYQKLSQAFGTKGKTEVPPKVAERTQLVKDDDDDDDDDVTVDASEGEDQEAPSNA